MFNFFFLNFSTLGLPFLKYTERSSIIISFLVLRASLSLFPLTFFTFFFSIFNSVLSTPLAFIRVFFYFLFFISFGIFF